MSKFGQYQLLERVAVGGMGEVYRARSLGEEGFEKPVAIKRILPSFASDVRFVEMLVTEARIHAPLSHRNIVQIHDLGISEDHEYFIVLEFVDGHDLGALLARLAERRLRGIGPARVPDAVALYIAIELGEGLHFAHEARDERGDPLGLIHRDISPSNVLLSYAGEVKLSDFGLAKRRTDHSIVGSLKGQLAYMSPEQARRAPLDRRTDIFSLGAVLFEMLTGQSLRTIADDISGWQQVASGVVPSARQFRPDILPALDQLLAESLSPDPRDRFPDARAFVAEARGALDLLPRSRAGEAGELTALLRGLLPPGRPRPAKAQSKVIRLLSELAAPPAPAAPPPPARPRESGLHPRRADAPGDPALHPGLISMPAPAPAPAPGLGASSPPPSLHEREESRPPQPRSTLGSPGGVEMDAPPKKSDGEWPELLDLVAPPITSSPARGSGVMTPPSAPVPQPTQPPPSRPAPAPAPPPPAQPPASFRGGPPPIPQAARIPPTPPPIPWPPPPLYPAAPLEELQQEPEGLSSVEEIEQLDAADEPMSPMVPMQGPPMEMQGMQPVPMEELQTMPDMPPMVPMQDMPQMVPMQDLPPMMPAQHIQHMQHMQRLQHMQPDRQRMQPDMQHMQHMQPDMQRMQPDMQQMVPMQDMRPMLPPPQGEDVEDEEEDPGEPQADWSGEEPPPGWSYPEGQEMAQPAPPYPIEGGYAVAPMQPPRSGRRGHVVGIAVAAVSILTVALTHYIFVPMGVLAVWRQPARLEVESSPAGAEVYIDGRRLSARTPTFTEVRRDFEPHVVELRLEGFRPERQELRYSRTVKLAVSARFIPSSAGDVEITPVTAPARADMEIPPSTPPSRAGRAPDPIHAPRNP